MDLIIELQPRSYAKNVDMLADLAKMQIIVVKLSVFINKIKINLPVLTAKIVHSASKVVG